MCKEVGLLLLIVAMLQYLTVEMTVNHLQHQIINEQQEGHDGPEVTHLYIRPQSRDSLNPRDFI
jgi:hypothetical protein